MSPTEALERYLQLREEVAARRVRMEQLLQPAVKVLREFLVESGSIGKDTWPEFKLLRRHPEPEVLFIAEWWDGDDGELSCAITVPRLYALPQDEFDVELLRAYLDAHRHECLEP